jgi:hypothetical protein
MPLIALSHLRTQPIKGCSGALFVLRSQRNQSHRMTSQAMTSAAAESSTLPELVELHILSWYEAKFRARSLAAFDSLRIAGRFRCNPGFDCGIEPRDPDDDFSHFPALSSAGSITITHATRELCPPSVIRGTN